MFKKEFGISIYPEHSSKNEIESYLKVSSKLGYSNVFLSLIHLNSDEFKKYKKQYLEAIALCKKYSFKVILDCLYETLNYLESSIDNLKNIKDLGVNTIRFDSPINSKDLAHLTHNKYNISIQINASNNDFFIKDVINYKPLKENLEGCHNFYPLQGSGLDVEFFRKCNEKFYSNGIKLSAFIGSKNGKHGPQKEGVQSLPTCEVQRNLSPRIQAKFLLATEEISCVMFGNSIASSKELESLSDIIKEWNKLIFDVKPLYKLSEVEQKILLFDNHFSRGDLNSNFIRSTQSRATFKGMDIPPKNNIIPLKRGDVCVINNNNSHYKGELVIILNDGYKFVDDSANVIANLLEEKILLDYVDSWTEFKFKLI